ncbi:hypothetical protein Q5P01_001015 [Channa striata]|uniref:Uncharacterized protein n=1 Tax=Channa striata TaxID=64152 RepID=A0AA88IKB5_CHASR|nr:hypothetical protein Q5P01_001015 [Channa striata]
MLLQVPCGPGASGRRRRPARRAYPCDIRRRRKLRRSACAWKGGEETLRRCGSPRLGSGRVRLAKGEPGALRLEEVAACSIPCCTPSPAYGLPWWAPGVQSAAVGSPDGPALRGLCGSASVLRRELALIVSDMAKWGFRYSLGYLDCVRPAGLPFFTELARDRLRHGEHGTLYYGTRAPLWGGVARAQWAACTSCEGMFSSAGDSVRSLAVSSRSRGSNLRLGLSSDMSVGDSFEACATLQDARPYSPSLRGARAVAVKVDREGDYVVAFVDRVGKGSASRRSRCCGEASAGSRRVPGSTGRAIGAVTDGVQRRGRGKEKETQRENAVCEESANRAPA